MTDGTQPSTQPLPDWLRNGGAAGALIHSINWQSTPLGTVGKWPPDLKASLAICLASRLPLAISWGPDQITLYNDAFFRSSERNTPSRWDNGAENVGPGTGSSWSRCSRPCCSGKRPSPWTTNRSRSTATVRPEECYFRFECSPIPAGSDGVGVICAATETTEHVLRERRASTLRNLTAIASSAKDGNGAMRRRRRAC